MSTFGIVLRLDRRKTSGYNDNIRDTAMRLALKLGFFYANRLAATGRLVRFYDKNVKHKGDTD